MEMTPIEFQAALLRQEHRLFALVANYLTRKKNFPDPNDPRRIAINKALWLNLLFAPSTLVLGGGLVAFISAGLLFWQNTMLQASLFPRPVYTAIVRPMVKHDPNAPTSQDKIKPDMAWENRVLEVAFAANERSQLYIDIVNVRLRYTDKNGSTIREQFFEAKSRSKLPVVGKSSIEPVDLKFSKFNEIDSSTVDWSNLAFPVIVFAEFSFMAVDSSGGLWSARLDTKVVVIDDGEKDVRKSDLYLSAPGYALRARFVPYDSPNQ